MLLYEIRGHTAWQRKAAPVDKVQIRQWRQPAKCASPSLSRPSEISHRGKIGRQNADWTGHTGNKSLFDWTGHETIENNYTRYQTPCVVISNIVSRLSRFIKQNQHTWCRFQCAHKSRSVYWALLFPIAASTDLCRQLDWGTRTSHAQCKLVCSWVGHDWFQVASVATNPVFASDMISVSWNGTNQNPNWELGIGTVLICADKV